MKPLILLVDDKPQIAKIISIYLHDEFRTEYYNSGREALKRLEKGEQPSLIVTDVNMPEMDGYELVKAIRSNESLKSVPIIVLSNIESSADRIKLLEMGADDFMLKPFNPEELRVRVRKLI